MHSHHDGDHHDRVHGYDDDDDDRCLNARMAPVECLIVSCSNEVSTSASLLLLLVNKNTCFDLESQNVL